MEGSNPLLESTSDSSSTSDSDVEGDDDPEAAAVVAGRVQWSPVTVTDECTVLLTPIDIEQLQRCGYCRPTAAPRSSFEGACSAVVTYWRSDEALLHLQPWRRCPAAARSLAGLVVATLATTLARGWWCSWSACRPAAACRPLRRLRSLFAFPLRLLCHFADRALRLHAALEGCALVAPRVTADGTQQGVLRLAAVLDGRELALKSHHIVGRLRNRWSGGEGGGG